MTQLIKILGLGLIFGSAIALNINTLAQDGVVKTQDATEVNDINVAANSEKPESKTQTPASESATTTQTRTATAPGNYNPSEEISDDLSVSFPVDI